MIGAIFGVAPGEHAIKNPNPKREVRTIEVVLLCRLLILKPYEPKTGKTNQEILFSPSLKPLESRCFVRALALVQTPLLRSPRGSPQLHHLGQVVEATHRPTHPHTQNSAVAAADGSPGYQSQP
jgi:hypothetical protein